MSLTYTVVVLKEKDGRYSVIVPALEGCATWGDTLPEALRMAEEAILAYVDGFDIALGRSIPSDVEAITVNLGDAAEAAVYKVTARKEAKVA